MLDGCCWKLVQGWRVNGTMTRVSTLVTPWEMVGKRRPSSSICSRVSRLGQFIERLLIKIGTRLVIGAEDGGE